MTQDSTENLGSNPTVECLNCGNTYQGKICSNCGQRAGIERLTVKQVLGEIPRSLLYLEKRFSRLLRDTFKDPIGTIRTYSEKKRKYYSSPVQAYYFFVSIYLLIDQLLFGNEEVIDNDEPPSFLDRFDSAINFMEEASDTIYMQLFVPIFLGLSFAWFLRKKLNLAESMALAYLTYTVITAFNILMDIVYLWDEDMEFYWLELVIPSAICGFLFTKAYEKRKVLKFIRGAWALLVSYFLIFLTVTFYAIIYVYVFG